MENCLPFANDAMVGLVHKCVQQTHLLALLLETLGYIPRLLNALTCLVYFPSSNIVYTAIFLQELLPFVHEILPLFAMFYSNSTIFLKKPKFRQVLI